MPKSYDFSALPALKRVVTSMSRAGRDDGGQLVELLGVVDGEGANAELLVGALDLALVLDRVVVMHDGAGRVVADQLHLGVGGDVEGLETLFVQLLDDVRGRVAFDRIGQQAVEALLEDLHGAVEFLRREQEARKVRAPRPRSAARCWRRPSGVGGRVQLDDVVGWPGRRSGHWHSLSESARESEARQNAAAYRDVQSAAQCHIRGLTKR